MAEEERRWAKPASGRSALLAVAVVLLVGLVLWLLAERNSRQWWLVFEDGALSVKKGVLFPIGKTTFKTDDPSLAAAYAPLKPPPGAKLDPEQTFDDRGGLDRALYDLLARWARDDVATERAETMQRGLEWVRRAELLPNLSGAQKKDLDALRAEAGFFEARQLVEKGTDAMRQARERLRLTAASSSPHAGEANEALRRIEPLVDDLYRAGRLLLPGAPRDVPAQPAAQPAAPPQPQAPPAGPR